jgi:hypothetical protein
MPGALPAGRPASVMIHACSSRCSASWAAGWSFRQRRVAARATRPLPLPLRPRARATQLYINLADNPRLDSQGFAPIGRVAAGMDVVDRLYGGYGETAGGGMRGGRQGKILAGGNAHLDAEFPKLDRLLRARLLDGPPLSEPR